MRVNNESRFVEVVEGEKGWMLITSRRPGVWEEIAGPYKTREEARGNRIDAFWMDIDRRCRKTLKR